MNPNQPRRLYCYVDETGQDTMGEFFIVSVVVSADDRDELVSTLEKIGRSSGKGKVKWMEARHPARYEYIQTVLATPRFKSTLFFSAYRNSKAYMALTVLSTAKAIIAAAPQHTTTRRVR